MVKSNNICPGCEKRIVDTDAKFIQACDRPYLNIIWHRSCWESYLGDRQTDDEQVRKDVKALIRRRAK